MRYFLNSILFIFLFLAVTFSPCYAWEGNLKLKVFHRSSCMHYNCKNCTAGFKTREEAIKAGYRPCGRCRP